MGKVGVMAINIKCMCTTFCQCPSLRIKMFGILDTDFTISPSFAIITKANGWWLAQSTFDGGGHVRSFHWIFLLPLNEVPLSTV